MARAWTFQFDAQVKKLGKAKASWYVGWYDPAGKRRCESCGPGPDGKRSAEKLRRTREAALVTGTYEDKGKATWTDFRAKYEAKVLAVKGHRNREETLRALDQFERIVRPGRVRTITSEAVAEFVAKRSVEDGLRAGKRVSPATVNKELRHLRAVLRRARKWKYLPEDVDIEFLKEPERLATYVPPEDFAKLYEACDHARLPRDLPCTPADWWRGLIVTAYMTGWRIAALLALRKADVDLDGGTALSRAEDNKGKRDQKVSLHPVVIEHLRRLPGFDSVFFPWNNARRLLFEEFARIQGKAKLRPAGKDTYGFHDLRRAFATMNADRLTADALQVLMQHKDYKTTQRYINMARQINPAVQNLYVPELPKKAKTR
jgi:integrase